MGRKAFVRLGARAILCLFVAGLIVSFRPAELRAEFDINKVDPSVVRIFAQGIKNGKKVSWSGSGFVINKNGFVATNNHVVENSTTLIVPDGSFERLRKATIIWTDPNVDLAVIKVEGLNRPAVPLAIPEPQKGTPAFAVGFPGLGDGFESVVKRKPSLESTVTSGVIGKVFNGGHDSRRQETIRRMVQHNAEINPGNSGGPLFNACNQVVAINTYGKKAFLQIKRHPKTGKPIAIGSVPAGIFAGSHVSVLIKKLKARNIAYIPATGICKLTGGGVTIINKGGIPPEMYLYLAAAFLIGTAGFVLALRKPRERIVKVVETYSQMLRRKGGSAQRSAAPTRAPVAPVAPVPPPVDQHTPMARGRVGPKPRSGAKSPISNAGWLLSGFDRKGHSVQIVVTDSELKRSPRGRVIGRKVSLVHHVITDRTVSRRHVRVVPVGEGIGIVDLNSTHGTKVGGSAIKPYAEPEPVKVGDEIKIGGVSLKVSRQ